MSQEATSLKQKKEQLKQLLSKLGNRKIKDIAIIGISGHYPGAADLDKLWNQLKSGHSSITKVSRWNNECFKTADTGAGSIYTNYGAFIEDVDKFDPLFFNISPSEAKKMDPQERLLLETVWETFEDAGYSKNGLNSIDQHTGVFIGAMNGDYELIGGAEWARSHKIEANTSFWSLSNRISYFYNLTGPSMTIDTACSSALTAMHIACSSIQNGDCVEAIVGGCNLILHPAHYMRLCDMGMLSKKDYCSPFGEGADGFVAGEGIGTILLKKLDKAVEDGDRIYGVIKGTAVNAGGKTRGYTVPNPNLQAELIAKTLEDAKVNPESINYIETHGTGTALGDPIEIAGLTKAFRKYTKKRNFCAVGSIKSNIGHLESASGMASIAKILLQFKHKQLAPSIHTDKESKAIVFSETPFYVQKELADWHHVTYQTKSGETSYPRRAGVSAFGAGGSNAFAILEEYVEPEVRHLPELSENNVFILSARNEDRLKEYAKKMYEFLKKKNAYTLQEILYTLQTGRECMESKMAAVVKDKNDLMEQLNIFIQSDSQVMTGKAKTNSHVTESRKEDIEQAFIQLNVKKLTKLWLEGAKIDWRRLYSEYPNRVSLPSYPFAKERYWVEETKNVLPIGTKQQEIQNVFYYEKGWRLKNAKLNYEDNLGNLLIFADRQDLLSYWMKSEKSTVVWKSDRFEHIHENKFSMDFNNTEHYKMLFAELDKEGRLPEGFVYLADFEEERNSIIKKIDIVFYLIKEIQNYSNKLLRIILSYRVVNEESEMLSCMSGYAKSLKMLMPDISLTVLKDNGKESMEAFNSLVYCELNQKADQIFDEVKIVDGKRYVTERRTLLPNNRNAGIHISKGTYLITGGLGAIGRIMADYLLKNYSVNVALLGRSPLDEQKQKLVETLGNSNRVAYYQADVTNFEDMLQVVVHIEKEQGQITGVIHAAGLSGQHVLLDADIVEFEDTLKPKVEGTLILDRVLKENPIKEFILFSSIASSIGDFGQCSYAVGNRFLDSYAEYRNKMADRKERSGHATSIQWPLWKDGAMHLNKGGEKFYLTSSGMEYLSKDGGLKAFEACLVSGKDVVTVFAGNQEKIEAALGIHKEEEYLVTKEERIDMVADLLKKIAGSIIDLNPNQLDGNENLAEYGYDSIYLKKLAGKINDTFGIHLNATAFFTYSTINELAGYMIEQYAEKIKKHVVIEKVNQTESDREINIGIKKIVTAEETTSKNQREEEIAVVGMGGMFPDSVDLKAFWKHLSNGENMIHEVPPSRWNAKEDQKEKSNLQWGGFVPDVDKFDAAFFNISPIEADMMDPQQRLLLQVMWSAIEDAGYKASDLSGSLTGVYVGTQFHDYANLVRQNKDLLAQATTGNSTALVANRISYYFNFHGPSESIDTACSSSLVAVHQAMRAIQCGDCKAAVAGGVSLMLLPDSMEGAKSLGVLAADGKCKTFDKSADGYVKGEGIGAVYLKSLAQAEHDGDHIYCVIKGSAVNHGGKANSLTAPNAKAQAELLAKAWTSARIYPDTISMLELHGTGTVLGDPIEVNGIREAYELTAKNIGLGGADSRCIYLDALKTNIGHLEPAAGIAGLIKVILCIKNQSILAVQNLKEINPMLELDEKQFIIPTTNIKWNRKKDQYGHEIPRRAGISAFGFGGTNCHILLEEYSQDLNIVHNENKYRMICLSARSQERLQEQAKNLLKVLEDSNEDRNLADIAYTLLVGREEMETRLAVVCSTVDECKDSLSAYLQGKFSSNLVSGEITKAVLKQKKAVLNRITEECDFKCLFDAAQRWIEGEKTEIESLFVEEQVKRVSLPAYPFKKERHWFEEKENLVLDRINTEVQNIGGLKELLGNRIFAPVWKEVDVEKQQISEDKRGNILAVNLAENQVFALRQAGYQLSEISIRGMETSEMVKKLKQLTFIHIIWTASAETSICSDYEQLLSQQEDGSFELFRLIKTLLVLGYGEKKLEWTILTCQAQAVNQNNIANPVQAAVHGLAGSIAKEYPEWSFRVLDLEQKDDAPMEELLEISTNRRGDALCRRGEKWYKQQLTEIDTEEGSQSSYRKDGVYVIIGGAGEVGYIWSEYMIRTYHAQIIWIGRRQEDSHIRNQLEKLEKLGKRPKYISADAVKLDELERAYQQIKQKFGCVNGIIHSAVLIDSRDIVQMDEKSFRQSVAVKADTCIRIAQVFEKEELDFYLFFSSVNSFLKARKQSSYSTGLAFKDAFLRYLSHFVTARVKVMNWGYWDRTENSEEAEEYQSWMKHIGIAPLETERAMKYLETLLSGEYDQILYLNTTKVSGFEGLRPVGLLKKEKSIDQAYKQSVNVSTNSVNQDDIEEKLKDVLAKVLRMSKGKIRKDEAFAEYGLDSLLGVNYVKALNQSYHIDLDTTCIYDYSSIGQLAKYIVDNYNPKQTVDIEKQQLLLESNSAEKIKQVSIEETETTTSEELVKRCSEGIAVIGISGQFPDADNVDEFWDNLMKGRDCVHELPKEYLDQDKYYSPVKQDGKTYCKWGGIIRKKKCFDPMFFHISPKEAKSMSPHQRLVLEESWKAIEDSGHNPKELSGKQVGVYVGAEPTGYFYKSFTGYSDAIIASRLSYYLDLKGPAIVVNTGCSSSAVAIHMACESLRNGGSDTAIAGGVSASLDTNTLISMSEMEMVSKTGKCHTFDEAADGAVFSEGIGMVVLKRLKDAEKDHDYIYGVIKASGINQDGASNGITAPNGSAQEALIQKTYKKYHIKAANISYIEAHGTGTKLGDPIETGALSRVFKKGNNLGCYIGSCKSSIGHTGAASGVIGLIRILKAMEHHMITKQLNYNSKNPLLTMTDCFKITNENVEWKAPEGRKLMAALNSFGHSGTNVHFVLEEYKQPTKQKRSGRWDVIVPVSARTKKDLDVYVSNIKEMLEQTEQETDSLVEQDVNIEEKIIDILAEVIDINPEFICAQTCFDEYGIDVTQWAKIIEKVRIMYHTELPKARNGSLNSIHDISSYLTSSTQAKRYKKPGIQENERCSLSNMAFVFQTGREAMEERVAFVGRSSEEICNVMEKFLHGEKDITNCYYSPEKEKKLLDLFFDDQECNKIVSGWIQAGNLNKVAYYWAVGGEIQWNNLYVEIPIKKAGLPTYPFREEQYWGQYEQKSENRSFDVEIKNPPDNVQQETVLMTSEWEVCALDSQKSQKSHLQDDIVFLCGPFKGVEEKLSPICKQVYHIEKDDDDTFSYEFYERAVKKLLQVIKDNCSFTDSVSIHVIISNEEYYSFCKGLIGALKTASQELSQFTYQLMITNSDCDDKKLIEYLEAEDMTEKIVCWTNNVRRILSWNEAERYCINALHNMTKPVWKKKSVYLITGGMGGIGLLFAKEIAEHTESPVLVLTGRSSFNSRISKELLEIQKHGAEAYYYSCDVGKLNDVQYLIQTIIQEHGQLDGVIHAAGVNRDSMIRNKEIEEVNQVLNPKVRGTVYLDEATKNISLSLFVMFASGTGVAGNAGQFDYAAANAFMDEFAQARNDMVEKGTRQGRTMTIDWPLWEKGGMKVSDLQKEMMKKKLGMYTLGERDGMEAFYRAYNMEQQQFFVQTGNIEKIYDCILGCDTQVQDNDPEVADGEEKKAQAVKYLKSLISDVLLIPEEELDIKKDLSVYGVDSMLVMEFNERMEKVYPQISKTLFFQYKNIYDIAEHMAERKWFSCKNKTKGTKTKNNVNKHKKQQQESNQDIAIIGLSGKFPESDSYYEFWSNISNGRNLVSEVPESRWDVENYYDGSLKKEFVSGKTRCSCGGFVNDFDTFDNQLFNIKDEEVFVLDPQERLALESIWSCLEDAGYSPMNYENNTGIFSGISTSEYQKLTEISNHLYMLNCRAAYFFDFQGPSITTDSGCSSTLSAIHLACQSLMRGECKSALVIGANMILHPNHYTSISNMLSSTKKLASCPFGTDDGYVPAESVGTLLLKPLSEAEKDGDHIYGVIKSTHILQEGKTSWFGASNPDQQAKLIKENFEKSGISPETVGCIEAASNGTRLGDLMEIDGLKEAFSSFTDKKQFCAIGSVKSNTGHAESASTLLQITKMLLQFKTRRFYPIINLEHRNPDIELEDSPFYFMTKKEDWNPVTEQENGEHKLLPRRGAISSFGTGGTLGHLILEEYQQEPLPQEELDEYMILLSADSAEQLRTLILHYQKFFQDYMKMNPDWKNEYSLLNIMYTLVAGRKSCRERVAFFVKDGKELLLQFDAFLRNQRMDGILLKEKDVTGDGKDVLKDKVRSWLSGKEIDFMPFFEGMHVRRVSLPSHIFRKTRFPLGEIKAAGHESNIEVRSDKKKSVNQKTDTADDCKSMEHPVIQIMSEILGVRKEEMDIDKEFEYYGMNSDKVVQAAVEFGKLYGKVSKTIFFEFHTIRELMEHFRQSVVKEESKDNLDELSKAILADGVSIEDALEQILCGGVDEV